MYYAPVQQRRQRPFPFVVKYEFLRLENFARTSATAGKARSLGRASARWLVIKVPPCTVISKSGYPFSGGTPATIKFLLLACTLVSRRRQTDQIYFTSQRRINPQKRMISSNDGCEECNRAFLLSHFFRTNTQTVRTNVRIRQLNIYLIFTI